MFPDTCRYGHFFFWYVELVPNIFSHLSVTFCIFYQWEGFGGGYVWNAVALLLRVDGGFPNSDRLR
jgi:hypothetical protein